MKKCVLLFGIYSWMMQECGMMEKEDEPCRTHHRNLM